MSRASTLYKLTINMNIMNLASTAKCLAKLPLDVRIKMRTIF